MNKFLSIIFSALAVVSLTSCYDHYDEPGDMEWNGYTTNSLPEPNTTIKEIKAQYCASNTTAGHSESSSNFWTLIKDTLVFEGVIVANDVSGNLYQSLYIRDINKSNGTDQTILLGIKSSCLYPYFKLGQRIRVNLCGLYVGVYSKTPKIGTPYFTSSNNNRLGPCLTDVCSRNIQLIGEPNPNAPELVPLDLTEGSKVKSLSQSYENSPLLATISGQMKEVQGAAARSAASGTEDTWKGVYEYIYKQTVVYTNTNDTTYNYYKLYAPECLRDAGYGIDRTLTLNDGTETSLRTSSGNDISFLLMPKSACKYTGILTYYSSWQMSLRDEKDIVTADGTVSPHFNADGTINGGFGYESGENYANDAKGPYKYYFTVIKKKKDQ